MKISLKWRTKNCDEIEQISNESGVYLISVKCNDGKYYVIYTGQSNDLNRRISEHCSDNEKNTDLKKAINSYSKYIKFIYAYKNGEDDLNGLERYLYDYYQPQFTERSPNVKAIECDLPLEEAVKGRVNFPK